MNALVRGVEGIALPALIDRAAQALAGARTSAEVLEARDIAGLAYDAAKRAARLQKAKGAHDALIAAAHRAQADALEIEAGAKRRLADEYDAAQDRGEIARNGDNLSRIPNGNSKPTAKDALGDGAGKLLHEARQIRDAEVADPGIVRRTLDEALDSGEEPTRAKVKRAVEKVRRPRGARFDHSSPDTQHDRDLRALLGIWESACESARTEFLKMVTQ